MEFTNTQIIIILLLIIVFTFIYNYDVYVIVKNEPICKPVFVTKRALDSNALNIINKEMTNELKQKVFDTNILEKFINYSPEIYENFVNSEIYGNLTIPDSSLLKLNIPEISTHYKKIVVDNIINVLANIPTNMSIENIKELIEYFSIIYQTSPDINTFFDHVAVSIKINQPPYNSSYSHLILYLIAKFDSIYTSSCMDVNCVNNISDSKDELTNTKCNVRFTDKPLISNQPQLLLNTHPDKHTINTPHSQHMINTHQDQHMINTHPDQHVKNTHPDQHAINTPHSQHMINTHPNQHTINTHPDQHTINTRPDQHMINAINIPHKPQCMCTAEYQPIVCNGKKYSNICSAQCAGENMINCRPSQPMITKPMAMSNHPMSSHPMSSHPMSNQPPKVPMAMSNHPMSSHPMSSHPPKVPMAMSSHPPKVPMAMSSHPPKVPMAMSSHPPKVPMSNQPPKVPMAMSNQPMTMSNHSVSREHFENIDSYNNNFDNFASF